MVQPPAGVPVALAGTNNDTESVSLEQICHSTWYEDQDAAGAVGLASAHHEPRGHPGGDRRRRSGADRARRAAPRTRDLRAVGGALGRGRRPARGAGGAGRSGGDRRRERDRLRRRVPRGDADGRRRGPAECRVAGAGTGAASSRQCHRRSSSRRRRMPTSLAVRSHNTIRRRRCSCSTAPRRTASGSLRCRAIRAISRCCCSRPAPPAHPSPRCSRTARCSPTSSRCNRIRGCASHATTSRSACCRSSTCTASTSCSGSRCPPARPSHSSINTTPQKHLGAYARTASP